MFVEPLTDSKRQEMSREKLLSKFFMAVQSFTYSSCCESFDAKRAYHRSKLAREVRQSIGIESVFARYGINRVECGGNLVLLPIPSAVKDSGEQPFEGRLGKLRYLALAIMSAAGAVSADVIQLSLGFSTNFEFAFLCQKGLPMRAPVVYPLLLGHIMTHVAAAIFGTCGKARAQGDSIDTWQIPLPNEVVTLSSSASQSGEKRMDRVIDDCENFIKLGLVARVQQVLLGKLNIPICGASNTESFLNTLESFSIALSSNTPDLEKEWIKSCLGILQITLGDSKVSHSPQVVRIPTPEHVQDACHFASVAACSLVSELFTILQIVVPGTTVKYSGYGKGDGRENKTSSFSTLEELRKRIGFERFSQMLEGKLVKEMIVAWYESACDFSSEMTKESLIVNPELSARLRRTQGFPHFDWPCAGSCDLPDSKKVYTVGKRDVNVELSSGYSHLDSPSHSQFANAEEIASLSGGAYALGRESGSALVTFSSKKNVPLLGGFSAKINKSVELPMVVALPTSYTDLYAELATKMPDCEQTAVCLICGEVLNAGGKGECTRHSYRCGAGAGMFFLLQECSGLIMHKSKAAYIHSPYVDSHGETPQYRGRPLNLDLDRYDHLREIWFGHGVRQQVVAERGNSRQVILPDFY